MDSISLYPTTFSTHTKFLQSHSYLASDSVLSIIDKEYWETYHSKILAQIWNCSRSKILCRFMRSIGADEIAHLITQSEYKVKAELTLPNLTFPVLKMVQ